MLEQISSQDVTTLQQIIDYYNASSVGVGVGTRMETCLGLIRGINNPSTTYNIELEIKEDFQPTNTIQALLGNNPVIGQDMEA